MAIRLLQVDTDAYLIPLKKLHEDLRSPEQDASSMITRFLGLS